jgi:hypothetical protein
LQQFRDHSVAGEVVRYAVATAAGTQAALVGIGQSL